MENVPEKENQLAFSVKGDAGSVDKFPRSARGEGLDPRGEHCTTPLTSRQAQKRAPLAELHSTSNSLLCDITVSFIDSVGGAFDVALEHLRQWERVSCVDCEGVDLGRSGQLCLMQIMAGEYAFLFDIYALGAAAFEHAHPHSGYTLKEFLEAPLEGRQGKTKLLFDVRSDADALWHQAGVRLDGVVDVQILEAALRKLQYSANSHNGDPGCRVRGLAASLDTYLPELNLSEQKERVRQRFAAHLGGDNDFWKLRPMEEEAVTYASMDVVALFELWHKLEHIMAQLVVRGNTQVVLDLVKEVSATRTHEFRGAEEEITRSSVHCKTPSRLMNRLRSLEKNRHLNLKRCSGQQPQPRPSKDFGSPLKPVAEDFPCAPMGSEVGTTPISMSLMNFKTALSRK